MDYPNIQPMSSDKDLDMADGSSHQMTDTQRRAMHTETCQPIDSDTKRLPPSDFDEADIDMLTLRRVVRLHAATETQSKHESAAMSMIEKMFQTVPHIRTRVLELLTPLNCGTLMDVYPSIFTYEEKGRFTNPIRHVISDWRWIAEKVRFGYTFSLLCPNFDALETTNELVEANLIVTADDCFVPCDSKFMNESMFGPTFEDYTVIMDTEISTVEPRHRSVQLLMSNNKNRITVKMPLSNMSTMVPMFMSPSIGNVLPRREVVPMLANTIEHAYVSKNGTGKVILHFDESGVELTMEAAVTTIFSIHTILASADKSVVLRVRM